MKLVSFSLILSFLVLTSCNYTKLKQPTEDLSGKLSMPDEEKLKLSYALLYTKVFLPKCVSCHGNSGNVNLENYPQTLKHLVNIKKAVFADQSMPKKTTLSDEEKRLLWNWIEMGGPFDSQNPTDPVAPDPLLATFESINNKIFVPKCISCHTVGGAAQNILLTKEELLNSPYELVLPNNPDESGLVLAIERDDDKRMPPAEDGYAALKEEEKTAIRQWIESGAND